MQTAATQSSHFKENIWLSIVLENYTYAHMIVYLVHMVSIHCHLKYPVVSTVVCLFSFFLCVSDGLSNSIKEAPPNETVTHIHVQLFQQDTKTEVA